MDLFVFFNNYTHEITSSILQLFSCLLNSLRLTASQFRLNVSPIILLVCKLLCLLSKKMNLEESIVSQILSLELFVWHIPRVLLPSADRVQNTNSRVQFLVSAVTVYVRVVMATYLHSLPRQRCIHCYLL
jgi:hypothetical protein